MRAQEKPIIKFPCDYPIKVIGDATPEFSEHVESVMNKQVGVRKYRKLSEKLSKNNTWVASTFIIKATSEEQVMTLSNCLKDDKCVKMVI